MESKRKKSGKKGTPRKTGEGIGQSEQNNWTGTCREEKDKDDITWGPMTTTLGDRVWQHKRKTNVIIQQKNKTARKRGKDVNADLHRVVPTVEKKTSTKPRNQSKKTGTLPEPLQKRKNEQKKKIVKDKKQPADEKTEEGAK